MEQLIKSCPNWNIQIIGKRLHISCKHFIVDTSYAISRVKMLDIYTYFEIVDTFLLLNNFNKLNGQHERIYVYIHANPFITISLSKFFEYYLCFPDKKLYIHLESEDLIKYVKECLNVKSMNKRVQIE